MARPKSNSRQELEKNDLIPELDSTLYDIAYKYGSTKSIVQEVLTEQLRAKQPKNSKSDPFDSGWETLQMQEVGAGEWLDSPEKRSFDEFKIKNVKKKLGI